jgi:hypothetical protein
VNRWTVRILTIGAGIGLIVAGPSTRILGLVVLVLELGSVAIAELARRRDWSFGPGARSFSRTYRAGPDETWHALLAVVERLGYRQVEAVAADRRLSFNTGMSTRTWAGQDFEASVVHGPDGAGASALHLRGVTSARGLGVTQSLSWGETSRLGTKVLEAVGAQLGEAPAD